jgi:hypothetical protein
MSDSAPHGILQSTAEVLRDRTLALVDLMTAAGSGTVAVLPKPVTGAVTRLVAALGEVADQAPPITAELDVLADELHAKRLSIQALRAELGALDGQLEVLEKSLAPVLSWSHQWDRARRSLVDAVATLSTTTKGEES